MDLTKKLIELLSDYIDENKKLKETFNIQRTKQTLYEELLGYLKEDLQGTKLFIPILLNTIYENNIYVDEFYSIIIKQNNKNELSKFIYKIETEYNELKIQNYELNKRIMRNAEKLSSAYRARKSLLLQTKIIDSKNDIFNIQKIINYYEMAGIISNKEEILLINEIEQHNRKVGTKHSSKEEQDYAERLYNELPNILTFGFQEHDEISVSKNRKETLNKLSKEIINSIESIEKEQIKELINSYLKYNLENNEFNYIITNILNIYLEELMTLYTLVLEKEIYTKRSQRTEVIKDYYNTLEKYIIVLNYYNELNESYEVEDYSEENNRENKEERRLIYSRSEINIKKAKIISDMSGISYEDYEVVYDLTTKFKNGTLGNKRIKTIKVGSKSLGHIELKDDHTRVILKRVRDNVYCVLGILIKKADNDMEGYRTITNRTTPNVSTDKLLEIQLKLSVQTEEELDTLVKEKARKNGRK